MATFLNPKTRKMKNLSASQREECMAHIYREMTMFDVSDRAKSPPPRKEPRVMATLSMKYMTEFYSNAEDDEEEIDQDGSSKSSSHALEIDLYVKQPFIKSSEGGGGREEEGEYNPLVFWRKMHSSYPILSKVAARILAVPASSAAVERQFSLTGNIITQKRARLCPDMVNDMVFQHSFKKYQGKLGSHHAELN